VFINAKEYFTLLLSSGTLFTHLRGLQRVPLIRSKTSDEVNVRLCYTASCDATLKLLTMEALRNLVPPSENVCAHLGGAIPPGLGIQLQRHDWLLRASPVVNVASDEQSDTQ